MDIWTTSKMKSEKYSLETIDHIRFQRLVRKLIFYFHATLGNKL